VIGEQIAAELPYLQKIARRWPDSDDLVQSTCCKALAAQDRFDGVNLKAWLSTIMRNSALDDLYRSRRCVAAPEGDIADHVGWRGVEWRLTLRDVDRGMALLPKLQRQALQLVAVDGMSYEAAGATMGMSANSVRGHLHRARVNLRECGK
jgi:RNA polymerase sigma-70 factor (ECF subfamily)